MFSSSISTNVSYLIGIAFNYAVKKSLESVTQENIIKVIGFLQQDNVIVLL